MRKLLLILLSGALICSLSGCRQNQKEVTQVETEARDITERTTEVSEEKTNEISGVQQNLTEEKNPESAEGIDMKLFIDDTEIPIRWENCKAAQELKDEAAKGDIIVSMSMYGDWEQVGSLGRSYTRDDEHMTAVSGDIVLYSGNQIVVFYGSNSWSYTKLGRMDLTQEELEELLSNGDITLTIRR